MRANYQDLPVEEPNDHPEAEQQKNDAGQIHS